MKTSPSEPNQLTRSLRIVMVVENNSVPFDRRVWQEALALAEAGHWVSVISPGSGQDILKRERQVDVTIYRYTPRFSDGSTLGFLLEYLIAFLKTTWLFHVILFKEGVDVVHAGNPPDIFVLLAVYARLWRVRFVFDEHDLAPETFLSKLGVDRDRAGLVFKGLLWFQRLSYKWAHAIISTNNSYRENVINVDPQYAAKTFVVRNGPDTTSFKPVAPCPELKKGRRYLAAYIGIIGKQDGVEFIVHAWHILVHKHRRNDIIAYVIGDGDDLPRIRQLAIDLGVDQYMVFTGMLSHTDAIKILSSADVCLSPEPANSLNNVSTMIKVMEYMALGKAIVATDLKETRYSAGDAALYVRPNDPSALADGMLSLLADEDRAIRMGRMGRERIDNALSWQIQAANLHRAYAFLFKHST